MACGPWRCAALGSPEGLHNAAVCDDRGLIACSREKHALSRQCSLHSSTRRSADPSPDAASEPGRGEERHVGLADEVVGGQGHDV
eukprot:CAMPEP_0197905414 /NCGR_PEP_ID=MMETSP1439-20131203/60295_1 /TAXON_ID=66791 /ORGANISM="Gonyaulax spinifera, Strain CCMP409" /LENGTH=84 /DNA_ID=CAMNT_0043526689 /DNA_START=59 /DNA_END=309 /DNA_ORIENTATION=-